MTNRKAATGLLVLSALFASWTCSATAAPITYTFTGTGSITGSLGAVAIGSADVVTFTFAGDTSNVLSFTIPVTGHEILVGTASVSVTDASTHAVLAQGTFLSSDGIFVSVDNTNGGVGFGSAGVPPASASFPGDPAYPFGLVPVSSVSAYDLQSAFSTTGDGFACVGFPSGCVSPIALATTAGDLILGSTGTDSGTFTAVLGSTGIPEPATIGSLAFGIAGLGFARRKALRGVTQAV